MVSLSDFDDWVHTECEFVSVFSSTKAQGRNNVLPREAFNYILEF